MKNLIKSIAIISALFYSNVSFAVFYLSPPTSASLEVGGTQAKDNNGLYLNSQLNVWFLNAGLTVNETENYFLKKIYLGVTAPLEITGIEDTIDMNLAASNRGSSFNIDYKYHFSALKRNEVPRGLYLKAGYSVNFKSSDYSAAAIGVGYTF